MTTPPRDEHDVFGPEFWDERYRTKSKLWSGQPNQRLVEQSADLAPGRALDVGCGEGADAIWLAERGWTVIGVDVSAVALERAAGHAADAGADIAGRTEWLEVDLRNWDPGSARFELVTAQFMHLPPPRREEVFGRLAGAVAPGGTLLAVGHHVSDLETTVGRPPIRELFFTGADIRAVLDEAEWEVVTDDVAPRPAVDADGHEVTIHDTVLRVRRIG
ncbi:class I SAM-dependent methyltransferase [Aldersonia kunmingensis]|uniref:class I SAM-dependent methyltransferase n=1 Tax=Aldersonia kunmingensis TaxID=408066 RepID=UPI00082CD25D|nr:class I SAM-dependent methyltransferase [Aldersonia kunmingensis]